MSQVAQNPFKKAERKRVWLKLGIKGPSGSGKSYSALLLAQGIANGGNIAGVDTENGSLSLYSHLTNFDVMDIAPPAEAKKLVSAIDAAVKGGYTVLIVDSGTHFWKNILEKKELLDQRPGSNSYVNWGKVKPEYEELKEKILQSPIHIIVCMRAKDDYIIEENSRGKQAPRKVGMAAIAEPGQEYEFTVVFDIDMNHQASASKDRTEMFDNELFKITPDTGKRFVDWLGSAKAEQYEAPKQTDFAPDGSILTDEDRANAERLAAVEAAEKGAKDFMRQVGLSTDDYNWIKQTAKDMGAVWSVLVLSAQVALCDNRDSTLDHIEAQAKAATEPDSQPQADELPDDPEKRAQIFCARLCMNGADVVWIKGRATELGKDWFDLVNCAEADGHTERDLMLAAIGELKAEPTESTVQAEPTATEQPATTEKATRPKRNKEAAEVA